MSFLARSLPLLNSMPQYTSSVFSRKMHHVDLVGPLVRGLDALEVAHRPDAGVQVEADAQVDVDAAEAAADGRGQRALQAEAVVLERLERVVGQVELALLVLAERADLLVLDLRASTSRGRRRRRGRRTSRSCACRRRPSATAASSTLTAQVVMPGTPPTSRPMPSPRSRQTMGSSGMCPFAVGVDGDAGAGAWGR